MKLVYEKSRPGRRAWIHVFPEPGTRSYLQLRVSLERGGGFAALVCGSGDVPLPDGATGHAPPLPLGPGLERGRRSVGVRVTAVGLGTGQPC